MSVLTNTPRRLQLMTIGCLYRIILNRSPDADGLAHYMSRQYVDAFASELASELLSSTEFLQKVNGSSQSAFLCENASVEQSTIDCANLSPSQLVLALLSRFDLSTGAGITGAFSSGIAVENRVLYNMWLDLRAKTRPNLSAGDGREDKLLTVIIRRQRDLDISFLSSTLSSIIEQNDCRIEVIVAMVGNLADRTLKYLGTIKPHSIRIVTVGRLRTATSLINKAMRRANGRFLCLIDEGDHLGADILSYLSDIGHEIDVVLSDQDFIDEITGERHSPCLNATFDEEAALACPPRSLVVARTGVVRALGGFRSAAEGEHNWDILLRIARIRGVSRIRHIGAFFLHKRSPRPDASANSVAGRAIVRSHLDKTGRSESRVDGDGRHEPIRVVYPILQKSITASIIIPTRDKLHHLRKCVDGIMLRTAFRQFEIIIVDNSSVESDTHKWLEEAGRRPNVRVLHSGEPFNWSRLNNEAVNSMSGDVAVLLNNDVDVINPDWLRELVSQAVRPAVGIVGAKLLYPDMTIQHAGVGLDSEMGSLHLWRHAQSVETGYLDQLRIVRSVAAVTGACLAIRKNVFLEVGGLEQDNLVVTWSDTDLCLRVRQAGYKVLFTPHSLLYHIELATRGHDVAEEQLARFSREKHFFQKKWGTLATADPFFSPDLVMHAHEPRLRIGRLEDRDT